MRPAKEFLIGNAKRMQMMIKQAGRVADPRRIQAILMRALDALSPESISAVLVLEKNPCGSFIRVILREDESFLVKRPGRGGRRRRADARN